MPLPEALSGNPWSIREVATRQAQMSHQYHEMHVPLGRTPAERAVRLHEMTHVKITPTDGSFERAITVEGIPEDILNNCEDARVHDYMERMEFSPGDIEGVLSEMELGQMARDCHLAVLAALGGALHGTGEEIRLETLLDQGTNKDRKAAFNFGRRLAQTHMRDKHRLPGFEATLKMARKILDIYGNPNEPPELQPQPLPESLLEQFGVHEETLPLDKVHGEEGLWATYDFEEPPLPLSLPERRKLRRKKLPDVRGRRLHRIGRLHQDGRVFANTFKKKGGGAVVIDCSSSMSLETYEVIELMRHFPLGVIGAYSSSSGTGFEHGTLRVIARDGRRVEDNQINPPGGGNGIDGPALDWLAKQPGPRYWISDAWVSGGQAGLMYCMKVCRDASITRVDNAKQIIVGEAEPVY